MATAGINGPLVPHMRPCAPRQCIVWMGNNPMSKQLYFWGSWGCVWPSKHSNVVVIHHHCNKGALWGPYTPSTTQKLFPLAWGLSAIQLICWRGAQGLMWGTRGPFMPAAAMVVAAVTPVVFVLRLLRSAINTLKLVVWKQTYLRFTMYCKTYYNSCTTNCSVARAQTSLVQWNPGILGIAGKLIMSPRQSHHHIWVAMLE